MIEAMKDFWRPYQRAVIADTALRIIILKARQIGISTAICFRALLEASRRKHHDVMLASTSLREAKELIRIISKFVAIAKRTATGWQHVECSKTKIEFPNGSRILALPALSIRSRSGTVILDEAALIKRDWEVWEGLAPVAEAQPDLRIILISTPFGKRGLFHAIWTDREGIYQDWSRHKIDVRQAAREGWPGDPEDIRSRYASDVFAQEFLCQFTTDDNQYFPHKLLMEAQRDEFDEWNRLFAGIDLASTRDKSVITPLAHNTDEETRWIAPPETIKKAGESRRYSEQYDDITEHLDARPYDGIASDGTGEGAQVSQDLEADYDNVKVWNSGDWKASAETVQDIKRDMEDSRLYLADDADLLRAFAAIRRRERTNKTVKFDAPRTNEGHADEFSAAVMAYAKSQQEKTTWTPRTGSSGSRVQFA